MKWLSIKIGKVCKRTATLDPRNAPNDSFKYVDISSIDREQKRILSAIEIIGSEAPSRARKEIKSGDILVSTVRPNLNTIAVVPAELDNQIASTGFCVLRPKQHIDKNYLFYYAQSNPFIEELSSKVRGAHYPAVSDTDVKNIKIPLPPSSEQRKIVEILDYADRLRKLRTEADKKAERILPALFIKMFGDPATNPMRWDTYAMSEIIKDTRNGIYKPAKFYGSGINVLKMFNIKNGELNLSRIDLITVNEKEYQSYCLLPGDVLINRVNTPELVGKCAVITQDVGKAVFESKNIRLRVKDRKATPEYITHYLNTSFGQGSLKTGVKHAIGMATINNTDLKNTILLLPPFKMQEKWSKLVQNFQKNKKCVHFSCSKIEVLFNNLLHRAFTGDLTASWRQAHMKELLQEMEIQARALAG